MKNKRQSGFSTFELLFVLAVMAMFAASFVFKPFKFRKDAIYKTKTTLSEAVFLARLHSMRSDTPIVIGVSENCIRTYLDTDGNNVTFKLINSKNLDSRISNCELLTVPNYCIDSDSTSASNLKFLAGEPLYPSLVTFKEKYFDPFQLKFSFDGKTHYIVVDKNAQIQTY
ncbi:MAG: type II secretion system GspH family protein [Puniceicoccales bacterium]|nr:type II secretion system GspH family protein [Puniceicoccales bacterium]